MYPDSCFGVVSSGRLSRSARIASPNPNPNPNPDDCEIETVKQQKADDGETHRVDGSANVPEYVAVRRDRNCACHEQYGKGVVTNLSSMEHEQHGIGKGAEIERCEQELLFYSVQSRKVGQHQDHETCAVDEREGQPHPSGLLVQVVTVSSPCEAHRGKVVLQPRRPDVRVLRFLGADRMIVVHRVVDLATQPEVAKRLHQALAAWRVEFDFVAGDVGDAERTNKAADSNSVCAPGATANERESPWACGRV